PMRCASLLLLLLVSEPEAQARDFRRPSLALRAQRKRQFTDVTAASGLKIADNTGVGGTNPHAVAVEDFDGDGKPAIIITTSVKPPVRTCRNRGNLTCAEVTRGSGMESFEGDGTVTAAADFDRDGHLDVSIASWRKGASRLYRNKGDGTFEDVTLKAGVA